MTTRARAGALSLRWIDAGLCHTDEHSWMPWTDDMYSADRASTAWMREVCEACPARFDCLLYAVGAEVTSGFWAGSWYDDDQDDNLPEDRRWVQESIPGLGPIASTADLNGDAA